MRKISRKEALAIAKSVQLEAEKKRKEANEEEAKKGVQYNERRSVKEFLLHVFSKIMQGIGGKS